MYWLLTVCLFAGWPIEYEMGFYALFALALALFIRRNMPGMTRPDVYGFMVCRLRWWFGARC